MNISSWTRIMLPEFSLDSPLLDKSGLGIGAGI